MATLTEIRSDLKEIRYYYARQTMFDEAVREVGANAVLRKVQRYNEAMKKAPPRLYDVYVGLYVKNNTQEGFSYEVGYSPEYIQKINKRLLLFLQNTLKD